MADYDPNPLEVGSSGTLRTGIIIIWGESFIIQKYQSGTRRFLGLIPGRNLVFFLKAGASHVVLFKSLNLIGWFSNNNNK